MGGRLTRQRSEETAVIENLERFVPNLKRKVVLPGCGHWTQQERPAEVNAAMLEFLKSR